MTTYFQTLVGGEIPFNPSVADPFQVHLSTGLLTHSSNTLIRDSSLINVERLVQIIESGKTGTSALILVCSYADYTSFTSP